MKNVTKNAASRRANFDRGSAYYKLQGIIPQRAKLRIVGKLVDGVDRVKFVVTKEEGTKHPIEMLLGKTDLFVAQSMGLGLMIEADATPGLHPIYSYPVQGGKHLPTALKGFENGNVFAVYNGKLVMRTGNTVNLGRFPLDECLYIPETQPCQLVNAAATDYVPAGLLPAFNIENIMVQLEENLYLTGTKSQPLDIEFPLVADFGVPADCTAYAVLVIDGWIYETGATEEMKLDVKGVSNPYKDMF